MTQLLNANPSGKLILKPPCGADLTRLPDITGKTLRSVRDFREVSREAFAESCGVSAKTIENHEKIAAPEQASSLVRSCGMTETYWGHLMEPIFFDDELHRMQLDLMCRVPVQQISIGVRVNDDVVFEMPGSNTKFRVDLGANTVLRHAQTHPNNALNFAASELGSLEIEYLLTPEPESYFGRISSVLAYMHVSETAFPGLIYVVAYNKLERGSLPITGMPEYSRQEEDRILSLMTDLTPVFYETGPFAQEDVAKIWETVDTGILGRLPSFYWDLLMHFASPRTI